LIAAKSEKKCRVEGPAFLGNINVHFN
jgi:hypothetical protein